MPRPNPRPSTAAFSLNTKDALRVLELIRRTDAAVISYRTAVKAHRQAVADTAAVLARFPHRYLELAAAEEREPVKAVVLAMFLGDHAARRKKELAAATRRRRALRAVRTADLAWRSRLARFGCTVGAGLRRSRVADELLEAMADDPKALILAADKVAIESSAGKDSEVVLERTVRAADAVGCRSKLVVVHCDLGPDAEWPGVKELARRQAERYGLEFIVVAAEGGFLGMVERRGMWPDSKRRLCTSSLKRDQSGKVLTALVDRLGLDRQAIVLNVMGVRAEESPFRAKKPRLSVDSRFSFGTRLVLTWNAVHELSETEIWREIAERGLEYHEVYDAGLERLSCVYCVLAGVDWLVLATRICFALGLPQPAVYVALERRIGHDFKNGINLASIVERARQLDASEGPLTWKRGDAIRRHLGDQAATDYLARVGAARPVPAIDGSYLLGLLTAR